MGALRGLSRGVRGLSLAPGHGPVPRRAPHDRRRGARGSCRHRGTDHGVLCLAVEDRRRWSRPRPVIARCGGGLLPVAVPQCHAARRDRGRRPSGSQPWSRRERCRPCVAGGRVGTFRRPGRAGPCDGSGSARDAVARAGVHAVGGDHGRRGGVRPAVHGSGTTRSDSVCVGATPKRSGRRHPRRAASPQGVARHRAGIHARPSPATRLPF